MTPEEQFLIRLTCNAVWVATVCLVVSKILWSTVRAEGRWRRPEPLIVLPGLFLAGYIAGQGGRAFSVWLDLSTMPLVTRYSFNEDYTGAALSCGFGALMTVGVMHTFSAEANRPWPGILSAVLLALVAASQWFEWFTL